MVMPSIWEDFPEAINTTSLTTFLEEEMAPEGDKPEQKERPD